MKGITVRHSRRCASGADGRCDCKPRYQAEVYDKTTGKRIRNTLPNKTAAKNWRQDTYAALRRGDLTTEEGPTLQVAVDSWLDGARAGTITNRSGDVFKPSAVRHYEKNLRLRVLDTLGPLRLREIRHSDLQNLVDDLLEAGCAPSTIHNAITPLRAIYRRALIRGTVLVNPTRGLEMPAIRSTGRLFASPQQAAALLAAVQIPERAIWATALYAGLRKGELQALQWADVNLASGVIHVRRGWDPQEGEIAPKSAKGDRKVPIAAALRDVLLEHRGLADVAGWVFGPLAVNVWGKHAGDVAEAAGIGRLTPHSARHTYASLMIAAGVNAKALSTFMGHANIGITLDLYGHLMPGAEDEAASLLDAYLARSADGSTAAQSATHPPRVAV